MTAVHARPHYRILQAGVEGRHLARAWAGAPAAAATCPLMCPAGTASLLVLMPLRRLWKSVRARSAISKDQS
eukprot:6718093-Prymnesium_polylepis.1